VTEGPKAAAAAPAAEVSLPLVSLRRERAKLLQKFQHAVPAVTLLGAGVHGLMQREHGFAFALAVGELAVSFLLLRMLMKDLAAARRRHHEHHQAVDWFDVFAAGVLTAEALEHWHTHHHLPRPTLLMAAVTLALGLLHGRLAVVAARRRMLRIDAAGIRIRGRFFRRFFAPWPDIERIDLDARKARIVVRDGRERRINLRDLSNAPQVRQALLAAQERLGEPAASIQPQ
jgi:PH (Pleckstrin Homology) domain-containing protein